MKKKILLIILVLIMLIPNSMVLATKGAEVPQEYFENNSEITP